MRAAIYCRLSKLPRSNDERSPRSSIDRQIADCRSIVRDRGWPDVPENAIFKDVGSASPYAKKARRDWQRLETAIEAGQFDAVVMWLEDRSNRGVVEAAYFAKVCATAGVRLVIADSETEYDFRDPQDEAKFLGEAAQAQRELARIQKRIRRMKLDHAEGGKENGGGKRPFGFTGSGRNKVTLARALAEQELIREAASRIVAGDSLRGICIDWRRRGVMGTTGSPITTRSLRRMLLSPRIAGLREHNGRLVDTAATWSAVIGREQWDAVIAILTDPGRLTHARGGVHRYLLSGLACCGVCGNKLSGKRQGSSWIGYHCQNRFGEGGKCVQRSAAPLEELITETLFVAVESPEWDRVEPADDQTRGMYERLARDQGLLDRLEDKLAQELISQAAAKRNRAEIERRMDDARARLAQLGDARVVAQVPRNLRDVWPDLSLDRQRAILAAVIERIVVHRQGQGRRFDPNTIEVRWRV
jgi:site-specific DNA recombinase